MGIPRRRALATFGGSLVTLAGCSSPGPPPVPSLAETLEPEVTAFLSGRTAALRGGDRDAWLAGVDTANAALVEHEKMVFGNLRQFEFTSVDFRRGPDPGGTP